LSGRLQRLELRGPRRAQMQRAEVCLFVPDGREGQLDRRQVVYQQCKRPRRCALVSVKGHQYSDVRLESGRTVISGESLDSGGELVTSRPGARRESGREQPWWRQDTRWGRYPTVR
jgi:hypothetical protein